MKLTASQLRKIIAEEVGQLTQPTLPSREELIAKIEGALGVLSGEGMLQGLRQFTPTDSYVYSKAVDDLGGVLETLKSKG